MTDKTIFHFTGIKGSGMSALARLLHDEGYQVKGSDVATYFFTQDGLEEAGIPFNEFSEDNIQEGMHVIAGNAFKDDHEEIQKAKELGLDVQRYHEFLGRFIEDYISIGVTGSHGKTSTTGLLAHVLKGIDSTSYLIGDGTGRGVAGAKYFALEADEYRRHFLAYHPDYAIITNVDFDHPDYFTNLDDVKHAYNAFAGQVKKMIFACGDNDNLHDLDANCPIIYYGLDASNSFQAVNIQKTPEGTEFDLTISGEYYDHFKLVTYGDHNIQNSLAVIAFAYYEGLDMEAVKERLLTYEGVKRRFNEQEVAGQVIIDDYAHHPTEIKATLQAANQKYPEKEIVAIFQPHTYSRTKALLDEFAEVLGLADKVYLCDIFASARESEGDITIEDLAEKIDGQVTILDKDDMSPLLDHDNAVRVFMGAGDIPTYMNAYIELLQA